jgi:tight adherence protein C
MTAWLWLRWVSLALLCGGFAAQTYVILSAPGALPNPLGLRGLRRIRLLRNRSMMASIEPCVRWLGVRLQGMLPASTYGSIDGQLMLAGYFLGLWPQEFVALCAVSGAAGSALGLTHSLFNDASAMYPLAGLSVGALLPVLAIAEAHSERTREVSRLLPSVMDLLVLSLSAGLDFRGALQQVVDKTARPEHPLIEELGFVLHELEVGKTRKAALVQLRERVSAKELHDFVNTVIQAEEKGNPLCRVLQIQAEVARQRRTVRAEDAAAKAAVKMMMPMLLVFAAILLLIAAPMVMSLGSTFKGS